jgi:hypothetical protein
MNGKGDADGIIHGVSLLNAGPEPPGNPSLRHRYFWYYILFTQNTVPEIQHENQENDPKGWMISEKTWPDRQDFQ